MTFTVQEVPTFPEFADITTATADYQMYDMTYDRTLSEICQLQPDEIKLEDPYVATMNFPTPPTSMPVLTASPDMSANMSAYEHYNPYMPVNPQMDNMTSPPNMTSNLTSNMYVNSPADSSNYSMSPQQLPSSEEYPTYYPTPNRQTFATPPQVVPTSDFMYYGSYENFDVTGKFSRRHLRDEELSPVEFNKRVARRERNREAALRCRTRRRERIEQLEQEVEECEEENRKVETEVAELRKQLADLKDILQNHVCHAEVKNVVEGSSSTATKTTTTTTTNEAED